MSNYKIFLDDVRAIPNHTWKCCRSIKEVLELIHREGKMPSMISFDHDLGLMQDATGYDIAKMLCQYDQFKIFEFPENFDFIVHSANPVGKEAIEQYMTWYLKSKKKLI